MNKLESAARWVSPAGAQIGDTMATAVRFEQVSRHFGPVKAVDKVDLEVREGEFFAMLGPSGSGKTTCLRLIAGFELPTSGRISIFGETVQDVPPYRRNVNTVFQDYALFPHLSVADNVAYALKIQKVDRATRRNEAEKALEMVRLAGFGDRRPSQLSGGQRQRVALARALINRPKVLLLDEPLGALDLKLREEMQEELKALQRTLGITFIFVTHDQSEAFSMADRVAVFNEGRIAQLGTPEDIYHRPETEFVAGFVGSSNVLRRDELVQFGIEANLASLRPECVRLDASSKFKAILVGKSFLGSSTRLALELGRTRLTALVEHVQGQTVRIGDEVGIAWDKDAMHLMRGDDE
jgi:putative spermidine/putrescine transport system ATP-binding protein